VGDDMVAKTVPQKKKKEKKKKKKKGRAIGRFGVRG
jgi:hypothetical protein